MDINKIEENITEEVNDYFECLNFMCNGYKTRLTMILKSKHHAPYFCAKSLGLEIEVLESFLKGNSSLEITELIYKEIGVDEDLLNKIKLENIESANKKLMVFFNELLDTYNISSSDIDYKLPIFTEIHYENGSYYKDSTDILDNYDYRGKSVYKGLGDLYNFYQVELIEELVGDYIPNENYEIGLENHFWIVLRQLAGFSYSDVLKLTDSFITYENLLYLEYGKGIKNPKIGVRKGYFELLKSTLKSKGFKVKGLKLYEFKKSILITDLLVRKKDLVNWVFDSSVSVRKDRVKKIKGKKYYKVSLKLIKN